METVGRRLTVMVESANGSSSRLLSSFFRVYVEDSGSSQGFLERYRHLDLAWAHKARRERKTSDTITQGLKWECEPRKHLQEIGEALLAKPDLDTLTPEADHFACAGEGERYITTLSGNLLEGRRSSPA